MLKIMLKTIPHMRVKYIKFNDFHFSLPPITTKSTQTNKTVNKQMSTNRNGMND